MKRALQWVLCLAAVCLPLASGFAWAAFNVSWWVPTEYGSAREQLLVWLHLAFLTMGCTGTFLLGTE